MEEMILMYIRLMNLDNILNYMLYSLIDYIRNSLMYEKNMQSRLMKLGGNSILNYMLYKQLMLFDWLRCLMSWHYMVWEMINLEHTNNLLDNFEVFYHLMNNILQETGNIYRL